MRIAHLTDLHLLRTPTLGELRGKRLLGAANLWLGGRKRHFSEAAAQAAVEAVRACQPDVLACSGDLTALGSPAEFEAAFALLGPLFSAQPTVLVPGNHDTYTRDAWIERRIEERFGAWTGRGDWPRLHLIGDALAFVALDVSRPGLLSTGTFDDGQLDGLETTLGDRRLDGRFVIILLHYPLRDRRGGPYGPTTRNLKGADKLEAALLRHAERVHLILHGHEHHGFRTELRGEDGHSIPIIDPGAGGYAFLPEKRRTAHFCVYTVVERRLAAVERYAFDGARFLPEAGGAFATGG